MIVIVCPSFYEAESDFKIFLQILEETDPYSIVDVSYASLFVDTDQDLRYMFIDRHYKPLFEKMDITIDMVDSNEFFDDIIYNSDDWYYEFIGD